MNNNRINDSIYRVAVIMSVYRSDKCTDVSFAIDSILNQTYPCSLYLYQDGPVSEEVTKLLSSVCDANTNVILIISDVNHGLAHALNTMIEHAVETGYDFIARMDSDDISHPTRIAKQVDYFSLYPNIDVLGTSCREFGATYALAEKHLPSTHEELVNFSVTRCPFVHPTVMFRCTVFCDGNRYPEHTQLTEDMALWLQLIQRGYKFANLHEVLLDYRLNESTVKRRKGLSKAWNEFTVRLFYMKTSRKISFKNTLLIFSRLLFHILPLSLLKFLYKACR